MRCWRITDKGLAAIGEGCGPSIKFVSLGFHTEVHDRGLRALATGCCNLELLAISDCNNVTDAGIRTVVRRCKLRILKIAACLQVRSYGARMERLCCALDSGIDLQGPVEIALSWRAGVTSAGFRGLYSLLGANTELKFVTRSNSKVWKL